MTEEKLTIEDIRNAVKELNKDRKLVRRYDKEGNWVDIDQQTKNIERIGLGKKAVETFKDLCECPDFNPKNKSESKITEFYGMKILESK